MLISPVNLLPVELLLQTIFANYLSQSYCLTIVTENISQINIFPNVFNYIKVEDEINLIKHVLEASEMGCSDYIVFVENPKKFITAFEEANHIAKVRRSDKKLIFLCSNETGNEDLLQILSMKEISFVPNLLLILRTTKNEFENNCENFHLVTHQFVGTEGVDTPVYLDQWNSCTNKFINNHSLFPHDMSNMMGKQLKVAAFTYKPYVLLDLDENVSPLGRDGTEMRIVDEFCRQVNCTVELVRDDEGQWGEIFDNRTGNGVIGNVVADRADVGITALYLWYHEYTFLDFSAPYIRTAITCIAPAPRLLASWELPILPFSWWLWLAVFGTFVYASIALTVAQRGSSDRAFLTTFGMMITQTQPESGNSWRIRSITGWMLITGLVVDNAYGGGLASTYTVPKFEKSVDTVQDLIDSPLEWGATHDAWIFSLSLSTEPKIMNLLDKFKVYDAKTLLDKSFMRSMAFSIEKLAAGSYAIGDYIVEEAVKNLELMIEEFYYEQCVMMARKSSPYMDKFNELMGRLHESGLILAWETQVALKHLNYKVQLEVRLSKSRRDVDIGSLHLYHVVGIFIMYGIGCFLSALLLLGELVIYRNNSTTTISYAITSLQRSPYL